MATVGEAYEREVWAEGRVVPSGPPKERAALLNDCVRAVEDETGSGVAVRAAYRNLSGRDLPAGEWPEILYATVSRNELVFQLNEALARPRALYELPAELEQKIGGR